LAYVLRVWSWKIIFGNRRAKNLRDILVRAKLHQAPTRPLSLSVNICSTDRSFNKTCNYCPFLDTSGEITSCTTGRTYQTKSNVTCKSNNLIYCLTCLTCNIQYVGQTKNRLMDRFVKHWYNIKTCNIQDPIGRHFSKPGHNGICNVKIHILDFIYADPRTTVSTKLRNRIERNWMHRLRSILPYGLNAME